MTTWNNQFFFVLWREDRFHNMTEMPPTGTEEWGWATTLSNTVKTMFFFSRTCPTCVCIVAWGISLYRRGILNSICRTSLLSVALSTDSLLMLWRFDSCGLWTLNQHVLGMLQLFPASSQLILSLTRSRRKTYAGTLACRGRSHQATSCNTREGLLEEDHVLSCWQRSDLWNKKLEQDTAAIIG